VVISSVPSRKEGRILRRSAIFTAGGAVEQWLAQDQVVKPQSLIPRAGFGGISSPTCESCPAPKYTEEARQAAFVTGTVLLDLAVTPEGRASQIRILRGLESGLTQAAIEAVRKWKFQPAKGPDGKPVTAWTTLEVNFRLDYPRIY
jgi:TonB family protein